MPKSWHTRSEESDDLRDLLKAVMFQANVSQGYLAKVHLPTLSIFFFPSPFLIFPSTYLIFLYLLFFCFLHLWYPSSPLHHNLPLTLRRRAVHFTLPSLTMPFSFTSFLNLASPRLFSLSFLLLPSFSPPLIYFFFYFLLPLIPQGLFEDVELRSFTKRSV